jgi:hypothetical protein
MKTPQQEQALLLHLLLVWPHFQTRILQLQVWQPGQQALVLLFQKKILLPQVQLEQELV